MDELKYLGYIICTKGLRANPKKIKVIKEWPRPKTLTEFWGFLRLTSYYRRIKYRTMGRPLTDY